MDIKIKNVPDYVPLADLANRLRRDFSADISVCDISPAQNAKKLHAQAAEITEHIRNRDYGVAERKAEILQGQLLKGNWVLGDAL